MRTKLIFLLIFCGLSTTYAQIDSSGALENPFYSGEKPSRAYKPGPAWLRHHKKLHSGFNGYFIEVTNTKVPLTRTDSTLQSFGQIHYDELPSGNYSYGIIADFNRKDSFLKYVTEVIIPKSSDIRLFKYRYGKRKELKWRR